MVYLGNQYFMCGIMGYIGQQPATPILLNGLRRLEYRGYDSAGMAIMNNEQLVTAVGGIPLESGTMNKRIERVRSVGKIEALAQKLSNNTLAGTMGIAHTRWATHGGVTEENAHPHVALGGRLTLVHNGIIENYRELKTELKGVQFVSQTDSEVLAHLIGREYHGDLRAAVVKALSYVRGTYGIVVMHADEPGILVAARLGSPIVFGIGEQEFFIASDPTPIMPHTKRVMYLGDGEIARLSTAGIDIVNLALETVHKHVEEIRWTDAEAQKQGFANFMLKEIFDQPRVFEDAIRGRYSLENGTAHLGGINMTEDEMRRINRIVLVACGTASHTGMIGKYAFERLANIPTEMDIASEFRYRDPVVDDRTLVFGISQSGETADTIAALREAKRKGAYVRGIVNVVGSTIARETDGGTYIHAGPELAVASTKAYTNMIAVLMLYALQFGRVRRLNSVAGERLLHALQQIPEQMQVILEQNDAIGELAKKYSIHKDFFFLGRGVNYPVALEGSLKLKEISYIHSEAYPGGEMKHGPIAMLSPDFPVFAILTKNSLYEKMRSNVEEARARGAKVIAVATMGDETVHEITDDVIYVPETLEILEPLLNTLPLQLFAYHMAVTLGRDVDRPRNLAKSVTVE